MLDRLAAVNLVTRYLPDRFRLPVLIREFALSFPASRRRWRPWAETAAQPGCRRPRPPWSGKRVQAGREQCGYVVWWQWGW
ncbi:hypothetical protein ACFQV2_31245 [Actinokineospora soli]|uniref:Uncharacterized protein n=1 Tax=Actinokineospora soli TaxID=1048753 RepID=A0ABW2TTM8_9PSEU